LPKTYNGEKTGFSIIVAGKLIEKRDYLPTEN
jgi:hypothetical protein